MTDPVAAREERFWDEHVPSLADCRAAYAAGPDRLTAALVDSLEPLADRRVLDFACGAGVLSAWLAARGARVVGLDVSPASIECARELATAEGLAAEFVAGTVSATLPPGRFDRVCGRFALHHTDVGATAAALAAKLEPGGRGAFLETMGLNPLLRVARRLSGHAGVPRYGTDDEHPLRRADLAALRAAFGTVRVEVPQLVFLRLLDRQLLAFEHRRVSALLAGADDLLGRAGLGVLSHQALVLVG